MFENDKEYHEEKFVDLDLSNKSIEKVKFEYCFFTCCKFDNTTFRLSMHLKSNLKKVIVIVGLIMANTAPKALEIITIE